MRFRSSSSTLPDSYRAGFEIGGAFTPDPPEVLLVFSSIATDVDFADFFTGLYDALGTRDLIVFGATGDGIYETSLVAHHGVCALGIWSDAALSWSVALEPEVGSDSRGSARRCAAAALARLPGEPSWCFVVADGVTADGTELVNGLRELLRIPFVGGLAGDDRKFEHSLILVNGEVRQDCVALLLASGPLPFHACTVSGFAPLGVPGVVQQSQGQMVQRISGRTPLAFIKDQIGKPLADVDYGIIALAVNSGDAEGHFYCRTSCRFNTLTESLTLFGSIPEGATVTVSTADSKQLLSAASSCLKITATAGFTPRAALVISCAGRKWQLKSTGEEEVRLIREVLGPEVPLIGFPSFGEIGPFFLESNTSYSGPFFHNASLVICLLGG
ncbi:hypothetical protein GMLC_17370 [Geomonas limicola]|uniref:Histidine kinase n=1 Tax=Geomonas limicola TaxID=2740186 RepID=A0A6V8N6G7_9BACT|nr:FIST N-terminal domain-containing protein [Geomonas limicola]GFO68158.1 hypothetical protein GMLC_17370 [Geomonas limicola]